jgi:hypothetical protein
MNKTIVKNHSRPEIGQAVFAATDIQRGELILQSRRLKNLPSRSKYSLEFGDDHILIDEPGVLINHSCSPNCTLIKNEHLGFDFIALKDISSDEEITFDYETIESEISSFKICYCGSPECRGTMNFCETTRTEAAH